MLVAGLRNPGSRYEGTRHNAGGDVVAVAAGRAATRFRKAPRFIKAEVAEVRLGEVPVVLALPRTFMNESGRAVGPLCRYYSVSPDRLLVVHDDIDLPFARLRIRDGGGTGGHNGVASVAQSIGTREFWRLKIGVGRPPGRQDPADYVLRPFAKAERDEVDVAMQQAADLVEVFAAEGPEAARQRAGESGT